jgi:hypothetical protein
MYYFYDKEILSEEFWRNVLDNKEQVKFNSELNNIENEKKFIAACEEFNNWIKNGPYEGEEPKKEEEKKPEKQEEEINIDDI